jgi:hypothetical protein
MCRELRTARCHFDNQTVHSVSFEEMASTIRGTLGNKELISVDDDLGRTRAIVDRVESSGRVGRVERIKFKR